MKSRIFSLWGKGIRLSPILVLILCFVGFAKMHPKSSVPVFADSVAQDQRESLQSQSTPTQLRNADCALLPTRALWINCLAKGCQNEKDSVAQKSCLAGLPKADPPDSFKKKSLAVSEENSDSISQSSAHVSDHYKEADPESEYDEEDGKESVRTERSKGYATHLLLDLSENQGSSKEWAQWIFVGIAVVMVGALVIYVPKLIYDVAVNKENFPVYQEASLGYLYSGTSWSGGADTLFRHTSLLSARYTVGIEHPGLGIGLATEGGWLGLSFDGATSSQKQLGFQSAYFMLGPHIRIAPKSPIWLDLDFLNGSGLSNEVGWITRSEMTVGWQTGRHWILNAKLGALYYDLHFTDGLVWRQGEFNSDLTLTGGIGLAYRF